MQRKAFNFYNSHWEQIKLLNIKQQLELFTAICQVQFFEININDIEFKDKILNLVWTGIKHSIETSIKGFVSKHKGLGKDIELPLIKGLAKGGVKDPCQEEQEEVQEEEQEEVQDVYYTQKIFYKKEYKKADERKKEYSNFINILFGKNEVEEILAPVLKIQNQLTYKQFLKTYALSKETGKSIPEIILSMHNKPKAINGNTSLYMTLRNWLKFRK